MIAERELLPEVRRLLGLRERWKLDDLVERLGEHHAIDHPGQFKHHVIAALHKLRRRKLAAYKSGYWRAA